MNIQLIKKYLEDLVMNYCKNKLISYSYTGEVQEDFEGTIIKYFDLNDIYKVLNKKWSCIESPELSCPSHLIAGYENLKSALVNGEGIEKYASKGIFKGHNDSMFNDWGILHFHLGNKLDNSGNFIERTRELAFVRFHKDYAYIIAIGEHGDWTKQDFIKVIDKYWKHTIKHGLVEAMDIAYSPTDTELKKLRKNNVNSAIRLDNDNTYISINSGSSLAGNRLTSTLSLITINKCINQLASFIKENQLSNDIFGLSFYGFIESDTEWGVKINGVAFVNQYEEGKLLIAINGIVRY